MAREATVLILPRLRDQLPQHWQTLMASRLPRVRRRGHRAHEARKTVGATVLVPLRNFENRENFRHEHS